MILQVDFKKLGPDALKIDSGHILELGATLSIQSSKYNEDVVNACCLVVSSPLRSLVCIIASVDCEAKVEGMHSKELKISTPDLVGYSNSSNSASHPILEQQLL